MIERAGLLRAGLRAGLPRLAFGPAADPDDLPDQRWSWVDLRLAPAAAAVWAATLAPPHVSWRTVGVGAAAAAAVTAFLLVRARAAPRRAGRAFVVAGLLAAVSLAAAAGAARGWALEVSPLAGMDGRSVVLDLRLSGEPHRLTGPGPARIVVDATAVGVEIGSRSTTLDDPVVVFAPGEGWLEWEPGSVVRTRAVVSAAEPGDGVAAQVSARGAPELRGPPPWPYRAAGSLRAGLAEAAARALDPRAAGLLPGLVVGDTSALDPVLTEDFRRAGLSHLTAVSGANVAIVVAGVLAPLRRRGADRRIQAGVAVWALVGFVLLAGPSASVLRAAAMGAVALLALASGRSRAAVPALCAAVIVLLVVEPRLATDAGFALSVAATAAIVLLAPRWARRLRARGCPRLLAEALGVSAAAGLVTAPLVAGLSGSVSLVSLPANLLAAPVVAPATVLGLCATLVAPVAPPLATGLAWLAGWPVRWLVVVAERAAGVPDGVAAWPAGSRGAVLLTVLLLALFLLLHRWPRLRMLSLALVVGVVLVGWPLRQLTRGWPPEDAVLVACDVGQGDGLVLPTGPGEGVVVDTGPEVGPIDRCLDSLGIDRLPLVLLSHLDADHVGGLAGALRGRDVGVVATGTLSPADDRVAGLDRTVAAAGATREVLVPGDRRRVGSAEIDVLAPPPEIATRGAEPNDLSMLARVTVHGLRILFTGDLSAEAEQRILARGVDLRADVLKVPHHGSADNDPDFLAATGARVAIVSVGADNTYGHPTPRLLRWLAQDAMRTYRTDRSGDIAVTGAAGDWSVVERGADQDATAGEVPAAGAIPVRNASSPGRNRRAVVTACGDGRRTPSSDLTAAGRRRGGGAAARPGARRGARRRPRAPPRRRTPRTRCRRTRAR